MDPTLGAYFSARFEQGTPVAGAEFHYLKITPEVRGYVPLPLTRRAVLAGRALLGWLRPYDGDDSPITRRYALGGPSNHRGFGFGRLSPQVPDGEGHLIPIGGDGEVLFSLEVRVAVTKISDLWLRLVPFVDAGDVTPAFVDLDLRNLNVAVGLDIEYQTPVGAVRAGLGVRVNRMGDGNPDPNDRIAYHITIGQAF
jgi:outer membrane translocation and assembly module TamA